MHQGHRCLRPKNLRRCRQKEGLETAGKTCEVKADTDCGKEKAKEVENADKVKAKEYWDCPAAGAMGSLSAVAALAGAMLIQ